MNAGLLNTVMAGVVFAPLAVTALAAGFPRKRFFRQSALAGAGSASSGMGYFPAVVQSLAGGE
jgi:hypothetical protein